jgi:hypothetical protein
MPLKNEILSALLVCALGLSFFVLVPGEPARAAEAEEEDPKELARQGMERMLRAIELMIEMIPQYEMPEVLENGDIIIRRKNPPKDIDEEEPELDETRT